MDEQVRALVAAATSVPTNVQAQVAIYDQFLLSLGVKSERDVSKCIKLRPYLGGDQFDGLQPLLRAIFGAVRGASIQVRNLFPGRLMKEHQNAQTISGYIAVAASFVNYVLNARADGATMGRMVETQGEE